MLAAIGEHFSETLPSLALATRPNEHPAVAKAKEIVCRNLLGVPKTLEIARRVGVSVFHLCHLFKRDTGMSVSHYANSHRVERTKTLLRDRSKRVAEVAFETGFESVTHFNHIFKKATGMNPKTYRERAGRMGGRSDVPPGATLGKQKAMGV